VNAPSNPTPVDLAQGQLDAYNAQDLDAYCSFFADDLVVSDLNGGVTIQGIEAFRAKYAQVFADNPENRVELLNRIVLSNTVVDHEKVIRRAGDGVDGGHLEGLAAGGKIARVDFVK
jgi:hypothetical protein